VRCFGIATNAFGFLDDPAPPSTYLGRALFRLLLGKGGGVRRGLGVRTACWHGHKRRRPSKYQQAVRQGTQGVKTHDAPRRPSIPINGTASDVVGIFSATRLRNTVNERSMVTPEMKISNFERVRVPSKVIGWPVCGK
jgi:hypothetical protein